MDDQIRALRSIKDRVIERFEQRVADESQRAIFSWGTCPSGHKREVND